MYQLPLDLIQSANKKLHYHAVLYLRKKRETAKCGNSPRRKTAFRKMRKLAQRKNSFPQNAEARPDEKRLSAKCGSSPSEKTAFRKMRKLAQRKNGFPQNAEVLCSSYKICSTANLGVLLDNAHTVGKATAKRVFRKMRKDCRVEPDNDTGGRMHTSCRFLRYTNCRFL